MKKLFLFIPVFILLHSTLLAQRIECIVAANYNRFYIPMIGSNNDYHTTKNHKNGYGYAFSLGLDDIKFGKIPFKFTFLYDHYTGSVSYNYSGLGSGKQYDLNVKKDILGLGIYPLNVTFFKRLKLSVGAQFNFLVYVQQNGSQSTWDLGGPNNTYRSSSSTIDNNSKNINQAFNLGINTSIRYEFSISENLWIAPQAMLYVSMTNEFNSSFEATSSIRPYLGIAVIKNLKRMN